MSGSCSYSVFHVPRVNQEIGVLAHTVFALALTSSCIAVQSQVNADPQRFAQLSSSIKHSY